MSKRLMLMLMMLSLVCGCGVKSASAQFSSRREAMFSNASNAELVTGWVEADDLVLDWEKYVGKVVHLKYTGRWIVYELFANTIVIYEDSGIKLSLLLPQGNRESREWVVEQGERGYASSGDLYVFVGQHALLALGTRRRKGEEGYEYKW